MSLVKKFAKFTGWIVAHVLEAMTTGITTLAAFFSLYLFNSLAMKLVGFFGFLLLGFLLSIVLAKLRGEDKV
ncbi:hypothetical protein AAFN90_13065 [Erwiniaceae bacterium CAU 1747]